MLDDHFWVYGLAAGNHVLFIKTQSTTPGLVKLYRLAVEGARAVVDPDMPLDGNAEFDRTVSAGDIGELRSLAASAL